MNDKLHPALAEHAMEAELQLERERHRKTWRQLEQLSGLLRDVNDVFNGQHPAPGLVIDRVRNALSQQAEPKCCAPTEEELRLLNSGEYTPQELWGDYKPSCPKCAKPAPAQDEREAFEKYMLDREHPVIGWIDEHWFKRGDDAETYADDYVQGAWVIWQARPAQTEREAWRVMAAAHARCPSELTAHLDRMRWMADYFTANIRPAQTEPPVAVPEGWSVQRTPDGGYCITNEESAERAIFSHRGYRIARLTSDFLEALLSAAPIAQTEQSEQPEQSGLIKALEEIAAGEKTVWRDDHFEVENDTAIDYPGIAKAALEAYRAALPTQGGE